MPEESVRVNFGKPFPIFPLREVVVLPHAVIPLFIFERRYRQMIEDSLDGPGQIAMAVYEPDADPEDTHPIPPIKPAVCLGQLVQHEHNPDGTFSILLQGICRAKIVDEHPPDAQRLYRAATLSPLDTHDDHPPDLDDIQHQVHSLLASERLSQLEPVRRLREQLDERDEPLEAPVFFDIMALSLLSMIDASALRYRLLAEPDPSARARLIERELTSLSATVAAADQQFDPDAPKGISWN